MDELPLADRIAAFPGWHYEFDLEGIKTPTFRPDMVRRHPQRRAHFFDPLVKLCGGSLQGRSVLDLGCNAGYWSLAAIEAGCDRVVGVDGRRMHIDQAELVFEVKGVDSDRYRFIEDDIFSVDVSAYAPFDIVLCVGVFYHVNRPIELFEKMTELTSDLLIVDTNLASGSRAFFEIHQDQDTPRAAFGDQLVFWPTRSAVIALAEKYGYEVAVLEPRMTEWRGLGDYKDGSRRVFVCSKKSSLEVLSDLVE